MYKGLCHLERLAWVLDTRKKGRLVLVNDINGVVLEVHRSQNYLLWVLTGWRLRL